MTALTASPSRIHEPITRPSAPGARFSPRAAAARGKALEFITQLLLVTVLPRLLGPASFGRLTLALSVVTVASVAVSLGAPGAFARFVPMEDPSRRTGLVRSMTLRLLPLRGAQLLAAAAIGTAITLAMPERLAAGALVLLLVALAAEVGAILVAQAGLGLGETWIWSYRLSARNVVLLVIAAAVVALRRPADVLWMVTLGCLAGLVFAASQVAPLVRHAPRGIPIPAGAMRFGRVTGAVLLVGQLTYRGPVLAASAGGLSPDTVGYAGLAASIAMAIIYATRELFTVSVPELVATWDRDPSAADGQLRRLAQTLQWLLIAGGIGGVLALTRVLPLVAGERFAPASGALTFVLAMLPLVPVAALSYTASSLRLQPEAALRIDGTALLVFLAGATVLMPRWEAAGALAALAASITTSAALTVRAFPRAAPVRMLVAGALGAAIILLVGVLTGSLR